MDNSVRKALAEFLSRETDICTHIKNTREWITRPKKQAKHFIVSHLLLISVIPEKEISKKLLKYSYYPVAKLVISLFKKFFVYALYLLFDNRENL